MAGRLGLPRDMQLVRYHLVPYRVITTADWPTSSTYKKRYKTAWYGKRIGVRGEREQAGGSVAGPCAVIVARPAQAACGLLLARTLMSLNRRTDAPTAQAPPAGSLSISQLEMDESRCRNVPGLPRTCIYDIDGSDDDAEVRRAGAAAAGPAKGWGSQAGGGAAMPERPLPLARPTALRS